MNENSGNNRPVAPVINFFNTNPQLEDNTIDLDIEDADIIDEDE